MIIYHKTKKQFLNDIEDYSIEELIKDLFLSVANRRIGKPEQDSWRESLRELYFIVNTSDLPDSVGVAIEYGIPRTSNRIDFILTGKDPNSRETLLVIELKQWQKVEITEKDAIVKTRYKSGIQETLHPSYQAWSYVCLLEGFNEVITQDQIKLLSCVYMHNYTDDGVLSHQFYQDYINKAPLFFKQDKSKLRDFINQQIKFADTHNIIERVENSAIKPSKYLADSLISMIKGNAEFVLIDRQKEVFETAKHLALTSGPKNKNVYIVRGGPGTGKSVIAINLLVELTKKGIVAQYVSKNAAPREVYQTKLTGTLKKTVISNLFRGSGSFTECLQNSYGALIVDEAHRLNLKSGLYQNMGENQILEIINAACFTVFFLDEDQIISIKDIGEEEEIIRCANLLGAKVSIGELTSQFRCNGSDGYLAWLDNSLQIRETANETFELNNFEFMVCDNPKQLQELIFEKNHINNKARLVAGYCWDWLSKKNPRVMDIVFPEYNFAMQWNLASYGSKWIISEDSVNQIGCIHTCQGLELDYIGVIIGPDLIVRNGQIICDASKRAKNKDKTVIGYKKMLKERPNQTQELLNRIIKNTYRTLMSRAMKGCYIYSVDQETNEYFKNRVFPKLLLENETS